jgi:hypothetical protein
MTGVVWAAIEALTPDDALPQAESGDISGTITPADRVEAISMVNRDTGDTYGAATFDNDTGAFTFESLPGDANYDLKLLTTDAMHFEGIDLSFVDAPLIRMADARYDALNVTPPATEPVTHADVDLITRTIINDDSFVDHARCIYLRADTAGQVTALVELIRDTPFHADGDTDIIRRVELWYFEKIDGSWRRADDFNRMVDRRQLTQEEWKALEVSYLPAMSVTIDREGESEAMTIDLPATIAPQTGRVGESPTADDTTSPILIGVPAEDAP